MPARLLASILTTAVWLTFAPSCTPSIRLALTLATVGLFIVNLNTPASKRVLLATAIPLLLLAVALSPRDSHDVWSYAAYGKLLSGHHLNPYTHSPLDLGADPLLGHVAEGWRHVSTVYGPAFTLLSAALSALAGSSDVTQRLLFQGIEAATLLTMACRSSSRMQSNQPLVWLLLSPATLAMVNGGHNDLLAGCLVALGIDAASRQRLVLFTLFALAAVLIKATAAVPVLAVLVWLVAYRRRKGLACTGALIVFSAMAYLPFGGPEAINNVVDNTAYSSRSSLWSLPLVLLRHITSATSAAHIATAGMVTVVLAVLAVGLKRRLTVPQLALICTTAFLAFSPYVLPWYFGIVLPLAALTAERSVRRTQLLASSLLLAYVVPAGTSMPGIANVLSGVWLPVTVAALLAGSLMGRECSERRNEAR